MAKTYRNELKFIVDDACLKVLGAKMGPLLKADPFQRGDSYRVRSLYFDSHDDKAFMENDGGVEERKKIRIRVYDDPNSIIRLEVKHKLKGKNLKENCTLTPDQFASILKGDLRYDPSFPKALNILYLEMHLDNSTPKVITEYNRSAFVHPVGDTRITFDQNISYSTDFDNFLKDKIHVVPLLAQGMHVLEVKYTQILPEFIAQTIENGELPLSTFSKYYLSRLSLKGDLLV